MTQPLRIFDVEFNSGSPSAASLHERLDLTLMPIRLRNGHFIIATAQNEAGLGGNLRRIGYSGFAIMRVEREDKGDYPPAVWRQIVAIVTQWAGPKDF